MSDLLREKKEVAAVHEIIRLIVNYAGFSSWRRMVRAVANSRRNSTKLGLKAQRVYEDAIQELFRGVTKLDVRLVQKETYAKEIALLEKTNMTN